MADHAWCHDTARDAAVRAAEDGRDRPLPTLAEAIARPFAGAAERSSTVSETGEGQSGLCEQRVSLSLKHMGELICERDAAIRERDNERLLRIETETDRDFARREKDAAIRHVAELRTERDKLQARVAELEAASGGGEQPRGWLTEEEREAIQYVSATHGSWSNDDQPLKVINAFLARSSPPEVVLPGTQVRYHNISVEDQRDAQWIAALAAAGVAVKEVPRE